MEFFSQIFGTIILRPYFVAFLLAYFLACSLHLGLKRAFLFAIAGYCIAWASEYSSIHNGIPYGHYYYICHTKGIELWVLGVPFMDSMSFVFLSYASYSMALFALSPSVRAGGVYLLENRKIRHSMKVRSLGALFCMGLDVIIDPVALKGDRWFLGQIYGYAEKGVYFGIPVSNFIGWFIVAFCLIYVLQSIDRLLTAKKVKDRFGAACTWRYLPGPALYLSIIIFNLSVTLLIGEYSLFRAGAFMVLLPIVLFVVFMRAMSAGVGSGECIKAHLEDFPDVVLPRKEKPGIGWNDYST
jgi:uncharacterized membrane protein